MHLFCFKCLLFEKVKYKFYSFQSHEMLLQSIAMGHQKRASIQTVKYKVLHLLQM